MNPILLHILLAVSWTLLTGNLSFTNLFQGFLIGYIILFIPRKVFHYEWYFQRVPRSIGLLIYFFAQLIVANMKFAWDIITPGFASTPAIVAIPLDASTDLEITMLANMITLTPGTLSLDVSSDKKTLYVHALYVKDVDDFRQEIKDGFERRILEVTRWS